MDKKTKVKEETKEIKKETKEEIKVEKTRKPREKVRPIEETMDIPVKKLTDKEKIKLIEHLKKENTLLANKLSAHIDTKKGAFARAREVEEKYEAMEAYYIKAFKYIDSQLTAFHAAVNQATKGGVQ